MFEDHKLAKIQILMQQHKYAEAEQILKDLLAQDADNIYVLSLLAEVKLQQDEFEVADTIIDRAIGLAPDKAHLLYTKARIAIEQDAYDDAERLLKQCIEMDPYDADYFALWANIKLARKQFKKALELADKALEIDAENLFALNVRSTALLKLDQKDESFQTIEGALNEDPNNAYTHANYGWGLLEKGDYRKAKEHFHEALKNDPTYEYAQLGLLEAIKATNPLYRVFLKYGFFMGNLTEKYQWGVIIGFYLLVRLLNNLADKVDALKPILTPLVILLAIVAFSTWIIDPISNLFLRFNKYGKVLLGENEKTSSNFVAGSLATCVIGILLYMLTKDETFLPVAAFGFAMMVPFSVMLLPSKNKNFLLIYTIVMAIVGAGAILLAFLNGVIFNILSLIFVFGFVAFQWIANYFLIKEDNL